MAQFVNVKWCGTSYMINVNNITELTCNERRCMVYMNNGSRYFVGKSDDPASYNGIVGLLKQSTVGNNLFVDDMIKKIN